VPWKKLKTRTKTSHHLISAAVKQAFENYGLIEFSVIHEPIKHSKNKPPL